MGSSALDGTACGTRATVAEHLKGARVGVREGVRKGFGKVSAELFVEQGGGKVSFNCYIQYMQNIQNI